MSVSRRRARAATVAAAFALCAVLACPLDAAGQAPRHPVLIVPGILGSLSSCLFEPSCPEGYLWDPVGPVEVTLGADWVLDPIDALGREPTYDPLLATFLANGYVEGETLFRVPYDWRRPNQETAAVIGAAIDRARSASGMEAVDIVAHSMGGLAVRHLLEAIGRRDVRKLALVATPNRGAVKAYLFWEGGSLAGYPYLEREFFIAPLLRQMKVAAGMPDVPDHQFVRAEVPSVRQLLPEFPYLRNAASGRLVPLRRLHWRNDLLPGLLVPALRSALGPGRLRAFAGRGLRTMRAIRVRRIAAGPDDPWTDGVPGGYGFRARGDDTVLASSACLPRVPCVRILRGSHGGLPAAARFRIFEFIAGHRAAPEPATSTVDLPPAPAAVAAAAPAPAARDRLLFLGSRGPVHLALTAPDGAGAGRHAQERGRRLGIPGHEYAGWEGGTNGLGVPDARAGDWILTVSTLEEEAPYAVSLSLGDGDGAAVLPLRGSAGRGREQRWLIRVPDGPGAPGVFPLD